MKKSTLLSLLTATSIVLTSAGTYAAWDKSSITKTTNLKFRNPVTISLNPDNYTFTTTDVLDSAPTASSEVTFNIENNDNLADTLKLTPSITGDNGNIKTEDFTIAITAKDQSEIKGSVEKGFTNDITSKETVAYTVTVKPIESKVKDEADTYVPKIAGKNLTVSLKAELSKTK